MKWRYFKYSSLGPENVYRWPDNGKSLTEQSAADVEVYQPDGSWRGPAKLTLFMEACSGWFDEVSDEISQAEALARMAKISTQAKESSEEDA